MRSSFYKQLIATFLSLFTSFSTLICCALPAILVTLGMGATIVSLITVFPFITIISKFKFHVFVVAGLILMLSFVMFWRERNSPCPVDEKMARLCLKLRRINLITLIFSLTTYLVGFFFAFLASYIL